MNGLRAIFINFYTKLDAWRNILQALNFKQNSAFSKFKISSQMNLTLKKFMQENH